MPSGGIIGFSQHIPHQHRFGHGRRKESLWIWNIESALPFGAATSASAMFVMLLAARPDKALSSKPVSASPAQGNMLGTIVWTAALVTIR